MPLPPPLPAPAAGAVFQAAVLALRSWGDYPSVADCEGAIAYYASPAALVLIGPGDIAEAIDILTRARVVKAKQ